MWVWGTSHKCKTIASEKETGHPISTKYILATLSKELHITQRHNTYTVLTILRNHRTKVVSELKNLALNYGTAEPQHYKKNCTLHRDTIHTLYLRYRGTTEPKSW